MNTDQEHGEQLTRTLEAIYALGATTLDPLAAVACKLAQWLDNHPREANEVMWQAHKRELANCLHQVATGDFR